MEQILKIKGAYEWMTKDFQSIFIFLDRVECRRGEVVDQN